MIIKGKAAQNTKFWSKHLLRDDTNEKAELREVRNVLARDLEGALEEMQDVSKGSRCHKNFMYQANINPRADEHLTPTMATRDRYPGENLRLRGASARCGRACQRGTPAFSRHLEPH